MKKEFTYNICLKCVKKNTGCCSGYVFIPLTIQDIKRISKEGYDIRKFVLVQKYRNSWIDTTERWWENSFVDLNGSKYKLNMKKTKNGDCIFLRKGKGCALGKKRPLICKIYPFWVNSKGKVIYEGCEEKDCLMGKKKVSVTDAVKLVGENKKKIRNYRSEIKKDCISKKRETKDYVLRLIEK